MKDKPITEEMDKPKKGEVKAGWYVALENEPSLSYPAFTWRVRAKRIDAFRAIQEARRREAKRLTRLIKRDLDMAMKSISNTED